MEAIMVANTEFCRLMNIAYETIVDMDLFTLKNKIPNLSELKTRLAVSLEKGEDFQTETMTLETENKQKNFTIKGGRNAKPVQPVI